MSMDDSEDRAAEVDEDGDLDPPVLDEPVTLDARVPDACAGLRLDQAAARMLPAHSRARIQRWIRDGALLVDGRTAQPRARVLGGERIQLQAALEHAARWQPEPVPFEVLHEDGALIVIAKPVGLVVHPGAGNPRGTLVNGLLHRFPELSALPRAGLVHRLDKDTSGLLVVARSEVAHTSLVRQLADRSMGRRYLAVVEGAPVSGFTVDAPLGRDPHQRLRMAVVPGGRHAVTHVRVLERYRAHALVECALETGRTHQIRVHLRHRDLPILGDALYGARGRLPPDATAELVGLVRGFARQALHAVTLRLVHPTTGATVEFECPPPADMAELILALRDDAQDDGEDGTP
ncbi:MAG: 23S rRNA pseudouridine(1911/1915/1917) synthase RluD [Pseudomonadales bacterium]|jgi:23S rRNA pseudouridine1911/1915/1917 synthase|nr:23S rRNA pseudouridine(1911/1915/1917) synthase RluD [Pseudomonadales bacterium]